MALWNTQAMPPGSQTAIIPYGQQLFMVTPMPAYLGTVCNLTMVASNLEAEITITQVDTICADSSLVSDYQPSMADRRDTKSAAADTFGVTYLTNVWWLAGDDHPVAVKQGGGIAKHVFESKVRETVEMQGMECGED